eukprot:TRINITY_DN9485_c0_g1_i1.p2 TRINITY_DN9485_c0_g1~~TRINITY_DN9485_c0_g1_i1.p2  ORF type:complete len:119 (-),score=0.70 TRINITY_DN9485_c0_g1_i1:464-820(-)
MSFQRCSYTGYIYMFEVLLSDRGCSWKERKNRKKGKHKHAVHEFFIVLSFSFLCFFRSFLHPPSGGSTIPPYSQYLQFSPRADGEWGGRSLRENIENQRIQSIYRPLPHIAIAGLRGR